MVGCTYVDDGIFQYRSANAALVDCVLADSSIGVFEKPARSLLVICELRAVVTLVEVLQHSGEHFRFFVGQVDTFAVCFEELRPAELCEMCRLAQNVFVSGEETLGWTNADCDDGGVEIASDRQYRYYILDKTTYGDVGDEAVP